MNGLSILIPTYNDECLTLVAHLQRQCTEAEIIDYEIIVADDGSTDKHVVEVNMGIEKLACCTYYVAEKNHGRSAIRNILARKAQYDTLLFIDSDMSIVREDFISCYIRYHHQYPDDVIYGGYEVANLHDKSNLRWKYEWSCRMLHTVDRRREMPYHDFHTSNFLIPHKLMLSNPFDERFRNYGYEDVFFGKQLQHQGIVIRHIDNPLAFSTFEDNASFIIKTEEGLKTLYEFQDELEDYSRLLSTINTLKSMHLSLVFKVISRMTQQLLHTNLVGKYPSLLALRVYKLGFYINIK